MRLRWMMAMLATLIDELAMGAAIARNIFLEAHLDEAASVS